MDHHRGYGLYQVQDRVNNAKDRSMSIRSGGGIITIRGDGSVQRQSPSISYPGVIVNVTIPCEAK
jgi:hypothetical protein